MRILFPEAMGKTDTIASFPLTQIPFVLWRVDFLGMRRMTISHNQKAILTLHDLPAITVSLTKVSGHQFHCHPLPGLSPDLALKIQAAFAAEG